MEWRKRPDYADTAYREAVGRLRILLAESYAPIKRPLRELDSAGEETDNQSLISAGSRNSRLGRSYFHYPLTPRRFHYYPSLRTNYALTTDPEKPLNSLSKDPPKLENSSAPPELMAFIERQEDYIEQLEKESRFCRGELSSLLNKVKDVISENENLHERQKSKLIKSVFEHLETETETETEIENRGLSKSPSRSKKTRIIEGPAIVFESRISELEAQLTQARIDLKKAQDENESLRRKINDGTILDSVGFESYKKQLDNYQREKEALQDTVHKLQTTLTLLKEKECDTTDKVKRTLDVAEQAQYEKNAADQEIRRLKDELERQHLKLRDAIADQGRRVADERSAVERRYTQQIEQLTAELGVQWETTNKLQLELDKQRRENSDLRRETTQKQAMIDELKKDMQNKIITLQSDIGLSGAEKSALEQQIASLQMGNERTERQNRQELVRLQAEIQSLRQRLDRADADLIHSRRENIRLSEQVASLEKEITLNAVLSDERSKTPSRSNEIVALPPPKQDREKELSSMIHDMENKHAATVAELENMILSQNQLMDKLSNECHILTEKLEDASIQHKDEIRQLQINLEYLNDRLLSQAQISPSYIQDEEPSPDNYSRPQPAPTNRIDTPPRTVSPPERPQESPKPIIQPQLESLKDITSSRPDISPTVPSNSTKPIEHSRVTSSKQSSRQQSQEKFDIPKKVEDISQERKRDPPVEASLQETYQKPSSKPSEQYVPDQSYPVTSQYTTDPTYDSSNQQYDPNIQYDPNQHYDPNQVYDPNQHYDPNEQYDPNQHYDHAQHFGPEQHYDPNQQYEAYDSNVQYQAGDGYVVDPNQQYQGDSNQQYQGDSNQQYQTQPNQQFQSQANQQYQNVSNQQYQSELNQQYRGEPNQQYQGDPNTQYRVDPKPSEVSKKLDDIKPVEESSEKD